MTCSGRMIMDVLHRYTRVGSRLALWALLLAAMAIPALGNAAKDAAPAGAILYYGSRGLMVLPPAGWTTDAAAGQRLGVHSIYVPEGTTIDTAEGFIYPRATATPQKGRDAAETQLAHVLKNMAARFPGTAPTAETGADLAHEAGHVLYVRRINGGPAPNGWDSVIYLEDNNVLFMLVLSCKTREARERFEPLLLHMAQNLNVLQVVYEQP